MKLSLSLLVAALLLPTLGSCGGGESSDPPAAADISSSSAAAETTADVVEHAPTKIEEAAKTQDGGDALEALENQAQGAVEESKGSSD